MNTESQVLNVPIEDIIPNRFQPRLNFDENGLQELADSIKEHGIIQPLVLRRLGDKYEIIAGERRYKAAKIASLTTVPAIISAMDDRKSAEVAIVENVQRRDLSSIEEAKSYKALLDKGYLTQEELAKKMGLSQSAISNKLRLLSLSEEVQKALMENKISERHARSLLQLSDLQEQEKWLETIMTERLTVRELDKRLKELKEDENDAEEEQIQLIPNIEKIKETAIDIPVNIVHEDIIQPSIMPASSEIPNKFFNFLEDESANMNIIEPISLPDETEEIEMLDFDVPSAINTNNSLEEIKDMAEVIEIIENLENELKNKNFKVNLEKVDDSDKLTYKIIIDKK